MNRVFIFHSLYRNRGRYTLFGILFALLGAVGLITLTLGSAADALRETLIDEYGRTVVLEDSSYAQNPFDEEDCARFNDPELVESMEVVSFIGAYVVGQYSPYYNEKYIPKPKTETEASKETPSEQKKTSVDMESPIVLPEGIVLRSYFHVAGYDYTSPYTPFTRRENPWKLTRGRLPETDGECLISDEEYDRLISASDNAFTGLGDTIHLIVNAIDIAEAKKGGKGFRADYRTLTVVGTLDLDATDDYRYQTRYVYMYTQKNGLIKSKFGSIPTVFTTINEARQYPVYGETEPGVLANHLPRTSEVYPKYELMSRMDVIFHLRDGEDFDAFAKMVSDDAYIRKAETYAKRLDVEVTDEAVKMEIARPGWIDPKVPALRARLYMEGLDVLIAPLETLGDLSAQIARNLVLLSAVLLIILTVLNLYARTYEIGVLRCIGMAKWKIALSLLGEHTLFLFLALGVGIVAGVLSLNTVIPYLIAESYHGYLTGAMTDLPHTVAQIFGFGLVLSVAASLGSALYIQRCRPLVILRNRS